ncbi:hypothetical protein KI688_002642 [Linnemannia hyalina]|uniref:2-oxoacid dehydrogenase acyltransferase catalytic domain-containing protein n=1 Tax=Linnemannia hyalina TaxID=64524 RepID=A0A9P8BRJ5_9FUNG|nr:hypothetical protein KI688_002642 [Linnemannia hyalina]
MPALPPTMAMGNIGTWQKKVSECHCRRAKILVVSGSEVNINQPIAIMAENKEDIEKLADFTAAAAGAAHTDISVTNMRRVIAQLSKQTVPLHYGRDGDRQGHEAPELLNKSPEDKYKLSVNDFIFKASARALKAVPETNSSRVNNSIRQYYTSAICVATSTPIAANAETKGLATIGHVLYQALYCHH